MFVNLNGRSISIYTLGCKVNQYESDCMSDILARAGCRVVGFDDVADIYIINTCSVTNMAERKSRQIIHRARRKNPNAIIIACGCYVQAAKDMLENDYHIDIVVGNNRKKDIARILDEYLENRHIEDNVIDLKNESEYENLTMVKPKEHIRAYVKVQDGCDNFCTYCIIPYTRGRIRSKKRADVLEEAAGLVAMGIKEIVITGINLSSYSDGECSLLELVLGVAELDGIERVRMGSLEPRVITEEFLLAISKNKKLCPHFHLSLQSACNETLKRMNRKYSIEEYMEKCNLIRSYFDRPAITTDIIVGFPGETDEEFETTRQNLLKLNLYEMHIFKYSKRAGTIAADMPNQVSDEVKEQRSNVLLEMTARNKKSFEDSFKGEEVRVLFEEYENNKDATGNAIWSIKGHTERYMLVSKEADEKYCMEHVNKIDSVRL